MKKLFLGIFMFALVGGSLCLHGCGNSTTATTTHTVYGATS